MDRLKQKLKQTPEKPGIYFLKNSKGNIIYVGKAKNLKKRLKSHIAAKLKNIFKGHPLNEFLYTEFAKFDYKVLNSEIDAIVEESKAIKNIKPRYNILLRDDKNYFYIGITKEELPRLFLTHQFKENPKSVFIGPFTSGDSLKSFLRILRRIYPYKTCKNSMEKPCFYYHLGLCPAHSPIKNQYEKIKNITQTNTLKIKKILKSGLKDIIIRLRNDLKKASDNFNYEKAAKIRDEIRALENILLHKNIIKEDNLELRNQLGIKSLKNLLNLKEIPKRIEIYDISNLGSDYRIGSMTVFNNADISPKDFRYFKIKYKESIGDPQMIYEIVKRRLGNDWTLPDLMLIDGGITQISGAKKAVDEFYEIRYQYNNIKIISLAKKSNILYSYLNKKIIQIDLKNIENNNLKDFIYSLIRSSHNFGKKNLRSLILRKIKNGTIA